MDCTEIISEIQISEIFRLIRRAGDVILSAHADHSDIGVQEKEGCANFVTFFDVKVQNMLVDGLKSIIPSATFIAEENSVASSQAEKGFCFVIDPIDGTTNFIRDYKCSVISVGLLYDGKPLFGAVFNPYSNEMYHAIRGRGAFCNEKRLSVSNRPLDNAIVCLGTSPYFKDKLIDSIMGLLKELFLRCGDIRRSGSAAYDLCTLAAGSTDVFFEFRLFPWDYTAASLIISEAGGIIRQFDSSEVFIDKPCPVFAASPCNMDELARIFAKYAPFAEL